MRYILRASVVLALIMSAWTWEMSSSAAELAYQAPAATVTSSVTQATGTTSGMPAPSLGGAYQTVTSQPATTMTSPAPSMMPTATYATGTQAAATSATPMASAPYTTYSYPVRTGLFGMGSTVYMYPTTPGTMPYYGTPVQSYSTPAQTYSVAPGQTYYNQPVRRGFGLFQRWRQQPMSTYGNAAYTTPGYPGGYYAPSAPVYTTYQYTSPVYYGGVMSTLPTTTTSLSSSPASPAYTPTMLEVPHTTTPAATSSTPAVTPAQGASLPAPTSSSPALGQGSGPASVRTPPAVPPIPRINPE